MTSMIFSRSEPKCSVLTFRIDREELKYALFDVPKSKLDETAYRICTLLNIDSEWDKKLVHCLCSDRKYDYFELKRGAVRYVIHINGDRPASSKEVEAYAPETIPSIAIELKDKRKIALVRCQGLNNGASKTEIAFFNSSFSSLKRSTPTGATRKIVRIALSKL